MYKTCPVTSLAWIIGVGGFVTILALLQTASFAAATGEGVDTPDERNERSAYRATSSSSVRNLGMGPLLLRGQSVFQILRLSLIPMGVGELEKGHWQVDVTTTWTNHWAWKRNKYLVDGEHLRTGFFVKYALTDWLHVRLEIPFLMRGGGLLDGPIMWFHNTFGFGQAGRDSFEKNRIATVLWRKDGGIYVLDTRDTWIGIEDIVLSASVRLTQGNTWVPRTSLSVHLKVPTGNKEQLFGSGGVDGGIAVCASKRIWKLYGYLGLQYTLFTGEEIAGIPMRPYQLSVFSSVEYPWTDRFSLIVQEVMNTGPAKDFYQFSQVTNEVTFGMKAEFLPNTFLEFGLIENLFHFDNSPDFGLHFGLSRKF